MRNIGTALRGSVSLLAGVILAAAPTVESLEDEAQTLMAESQALIAAADEGTGRQLTEDELKTIEDNEKRVIALGRQISARKMADPALLPWAGRRSAEPGANNPTGGSAARRVPAEPRSVPRGQHGFGTFGEFAQGVRAHTAKVGADDYVPLKKLRAALTTWGDESAGADGGFVVPPDFSTQIWEKVQAEDPLMTMCSQLTTSSNSMLIPKDETTPWGASGIQAYWESEAQQYTQSKPALDLSPLRLMKLTALVPVSDELLEDGVGLESWLRAKAPQMMSQKINTGIVAGTGLGQPQGIITAPSAVTVAKENSQDAGSIWFANINKMWAGMYAPWRRNAVWLINQDAEVQLDAMAFSPTSTVPVPIYMPQNGLSASPYASLKGRPVIPSQACSGLGNLGDIILVDLKQYWVLQKSSGMRTDVSIHLFFDQSATTFRFVFRINGQPAWGKTITQQNSSNALSWAVLLAARA